MIKKSFKYILPTLFVSANSYAGSPTVDKFSEKLDNVIRKSNSMNPDDISNFCKKASSSLQEAYKTKNNSIWNQILREINESSADGISGAIDFNPGPLRFQLSYDSHSRFLAPQKHAGEDKFIFSLGLAFPLSSGETPIGFSLTDRREVSFTRIYPNLCSSLVRLPYNPIKRMPISADKALALEVGELVSYSAPFTVSIGAGVQSGFASAGIGVFHTADVDVNIFKMDNTKVRVRMVARKDRGFSFNAGYNKKVMRVIRLENINLSMSHSNSDAVLIDYIFDLTDSAAKQTYTDLVAPHDIASYDINDTKIKAKAVFLGDSSLVKTLLIDEQKILDAAKNNPNNVTKVMASDAKIESSSGGISINFINSIKLETRNNYADTSITQTDSNNKQINRFFTRTIESIERSKFFSLSSKDRYQLGTILTDENSGSPLGFLFQKSSNKQHLTDLSLKKWSTYLNLLPMTAGSPDVDSKLAKIKEAGRMQTREMFFVDEEQFFKNSSNFSHQFFKDEIVKIFQQAIDNKAMLTSEPSGTDVHSDSGNQMLDAHRRYLAYPKYWESLSASKKMEELKWMYRYELNTVIPEALMNIADKSLDKDKRRLSFNALMQTPLFNEIGINLLTRVIPRDSLKNTVIYEVVLQSNNSAVEPIFITYGDTSNKHYVTSQNAIMAKNFSLEPGSELRIYLKGDATIKTAEEVIAETHK